MPTFCSTLRPLPQSSPTLPRRCHSSRRAPPHTPLHPAAHAPGRDHWALPRPHLWGCQGTRGLVREATGIGKEQGHCQRCRKRLYNVYVTRRPRSGHTPPPTSNFWGASRSLFPLYHLAYSLRSLQATTVPASLIAAPASTPAAPTQCCGTVTSAVAPFCLSGSICLSSYLFVYLFPIFPLTCLFST